MNVLVTPYRVAQFTLEEVREFWPRLERMLDSVPHTWRHWTKEHIRGSIENNSLQVWGIGPPGKATLILFTTVNAFPALKVLTVVWAAGTFDDAMLPLLEMTLGSFARLNSCDEVEIRGRLGWESKLKTLGFRHETSMWTRRIDNVRMN